MPENRGLDTGYGQGLQEERLTSMLAEMVEITEMSERHKHALRRMDEQLESLNQSMFEAIDRDDYDESDRSEPRQC